MAKTKHSWHEAKKIAYERQGGRCSLCDRRVQFRLCVGHHIRNRSKGGNNHPSNCEVRCVECETKAHRKWKDGNPPPIFEQEERQVQYYFRPKRRR